MRAVITVLGKDTVGILAKVSTICAEEGANVTEVTQSVLQDMFAMIMLVEMSDSTEIIEKLSKKSEVLEKELNLKIHVMHEDLFNSMHRI